MKDLLWVKSLFKNRNLRSHRIRLQKGDTLIFRTSCLLAKNTPSSDIVPSYSSNMWYIKCSHTPQKWFNDVQWYLLVTSQTQSFFQWSSKALHLLFPKLPTWHLNTFPFLGYTGCFRCQVLKLGRGHESDVRIADVSISRGSEEFCQTFLAQKKWTCQIYSNINIHQCQSFRLLIVQFRSLIVIGLFMANWPREKIYFLGYQSGWKLFDVRSMITTGFNAGNILQTHLKFGMPTGSF